MASTVKLQLPLRRQAATRFTVLEWALIERAAAAQRTTVGRLLREAAVRAAKRLLAKRGTHESQR